MAKGVSIESGAQFSFQAVANKKLTAGSVFTAINNTSATPIAGTFANLPDGSTFTAGRNKFQASYEGGTGNDLTLAVVPQGGRPRMTRMARMRSRSKSIRVIRAIRGSIFVL